MKVLSSLSTLFLAIVLLVVLYFVMPQVTRFVDNEAIHECAMDYHQEVTNQQTGEKIVRPLEQQAVECVSNKGVRGWKGVWSK